VQPAHLLVLGVQSVVEASDGHHDDAFPRHILEGSGDGNGPTLADQIRIHVKHWGKGGHFESRGNEHEIKGLKTSCRGR